jgi:hypothetical protein
MTAASASAATQQQQQRQAAAAPSSLDERLRLLLDGEDGREFSVVQYLNLALATAGAEEDATLTAPSDSNKARGRQQVPPPPSSSSQQQQQRLAELALQLQVQTSSCHEEIGRVSAELQAILPRCGADLGRLGSGLEGLGRDARALLEAHRGGDGAGGAGACSPTGEAAGDPASQGGATGASSSLETLSSLHSLQSNLQRTREILVAASQWDATLQLIPSLLASSASSSAALTSSASTASSTTAPAAPPHQQQHQHHNLDRAVAALAQLETYQKDLSGMPAGNEERERQRARLRDQVMSLLAPVLQNALASLAGSGGRVVQPLQHCAGLYGRLGALEALQAEYVRRRPAALHRLWFDHDPRRRPFAAWLPSWLDAAYQLVAEELRQSAAVFGGGAGAAPGAAGASSSSPAGAPASAVPIAVTLRVLRECFRPLKASWSSRLESLCSSSSSGSGAENDPGDLEGLCAAYESLLQFLSIAYNTIVGSYQDLVEAGAGEPPGTMRGGSAACTGGDNPAALAPGRLFEELADAFVAVSSPFAPFQERFGQLESRYSRARSASGWERRLRAVLGAASGAAAVGSGGDDEEDGGDEPDPRGPRSPAAPAASNQPASSLVTPDGLSRACDELLRLLPAVFEGAEGSLDRYELLLGGYAASESALRPVDEALSAQLRHLSALVSTLSRLSREALLSGDARRHQQQHLDEDAVAASLQLLHVAGSALERSRAFDVLARARMAAWSDRLAASAASQPSSLVLPDSLSPAEVDSIVTKAVAASVLGEDAATARSALLELLSSDAEVATAEPSAPGSLLFPQAHDAVQDVCRACQVLVFEACSAVPLRHLSALPSMACWKEGGAAAASSSAGSSGEYGTLPQPYMTHVGEHMLALVQALEPFASDPNSLALAGPAMAGVRLVAAAPWRDLLQSTPGGGAAGGDGAVLKLMDGKCLAGLLLADPSASGGGPREKEEDQDRAEGDVEGEEDEVAGSTAFCNAWLDAVGCAVTGRLLERIVRIPSLTGRGCEHLSADLTYLANVLSALDVAGHPHPLLGHVARLAAAEDGEEVSELIARRGRAEGPVEAALASIEERMAAIRGVAARYNY